MENENVEITEEVSQEPEMVEENAVEENENVEQNDNINQVEEVNQTKNFEPNHKNVWKRVFFSWDNYHDKKHEDQILSFQHDFSLQFFLIQRDWLGQQNHQDPRTRHNLLLPREVQYSLLHLTRHFLLWLPKYSDTYSNTRL